uniref:Spermatogenesis-associated protein 6 N-terminal domain-containing protein n=1 Tax=Ailuropoda melanoleuca TaxID=9646 RepID=G1L7D7_AILME
MDEKRFFSLFCFVEQSFHFFLLLCYDLGRLLKLTHETRSRSLSYSTSCITGALIKMSVFIGVLSFRECKSTYGFSPFFLVWEELACYEENTRDFLFPEPKLTPSLPGMCREVLMKTIAGFPGIAPKIEFSTRTAIRERVFLQRNRFPGERYNKSIRPLSATDGPKLPLNNMKTKPKESNLNRLPQSMQSRAPSPVSPRRCLHDQPAQLNLGNNIRISGENKPPFVVRHVDSAKPFGENISECQSRNSRRKLKFSNLPFPGRRGTRQSQMRGCPFPTSPHC